MRRSENAPIGVLIELCRAVGFASRSADGSSSTCSGMVGVIDTASLAPGETDDRRHAVAREVRHWPYEVWCGR